MVQMHYIRRVKYYNIPCQNQSSDLQCFHDDTFVCLCQNFGDQRLADCVDIENTEMPSNPIFSYDEIEHSCFVNHQIDFSTEASSSSSMPSTVSKSILITPLTLTITSNKSNITTSFIDTNTTTTAAPSDFACIHSLNIFILLFCLNLH